MNKRVVFNFYVRLSALQFSLFPPSRFLFNVSPPGPEPLTPFRQTLPLLFLCIRTHKVLKFSAYILRAQCLQWLRRT